MDHPEGCHRPQPFSLLSETGNELLERVALLSISVLESHNSLDRRNPVTIVGIVVVQCTTVARVADAHVVGVASVGSPQLKSNTSHKVTNSPFPMFILEIHALYSLAY